MFLQASTPSLPVFFNGFVHNIIKTKSWAHICLDTTIMTFVQSSQQVVALLFQVVFYLTEFSQITCRLFICPVWLWCYCEKDCLQQLYLVCRTARSKQVPKHLLARLLIIRVCVCVCVCVNVCFMEALIFSLLRHRCYFQLHWFI